MENEKIRIIALGGLGEVGRNMMLLEYKKSILIIDIGLGFPDENMHEKYYRSNFHSWTL